MKSRCNASDLVQIKHLKGSWPGAKACSIQVGDLVVSPDLHPQGGRSFAPGRLALGVSQVALDQILRTKACPPEGADGCSFLPFRQEACTQSVLSGPAALRRRSG